MTTRIDPPDARRERAVCMDLFCGAGGSARGLQMAGFYVVGVDNKPQPRYAGDEFIQMDALEALRRLELGDSVGDHLWSTIDLFNASPPCQFAGGLPKTAYYDPSEHPNLIPSTRAALERMRKPYLIENVVRARRWLQNPIRLCGRMFGLKTYRHRLFESNILLLEPEHTPHQEACPKAGTRGIPECGYISVCGHVSQMRFARRAMGIDWMTRDELTQAIPPAYLHYLGVQLMRHIEAERRGRGWRLGG